MIRSTMFHSALLALALTTACGKDERKAPAPKASGTAAPAATPTTPPPPAPPPAPAKPAVTLFKEETHKFTVESARTPNRSQQQVPTAIGPVTAHVYMFSAPSAPGAMMVMATPSFLPEDKLDLDKILEDSQQGSLTSVGGTLVESTKLELDGAVGRAFRFTAKPQGHAATGYAKILIRDRTLYQVMVVSMESAKEFQAEGNAFVDSFHLLPGT